MKISETNEVSEQLSMFGLKATANIRNQSPGQVVLEVLEIAYPAKESIRYDKFRD
jgi:hypothetical protein